ncbi:MAG: sodium:alanine symporter family protein [Firmicutes bacterium]|nr:sodium:alanine symporter family protein [Bacillota bacterium]
MDKISEINGVVNGFVWGLPTILMILGVGLFLTIVLKGIQFRNIGFLIHSTYVKALSKKGRESQAGDGDITSFQAAMTSISAVVGSGNIAGCATALVSGGPGALFWMIVAAFVGMATKFGEIALGIKYREQKPDGSYAGGPMYYLAKGLHAPWLGAVVAIMIVFYSFIVCCVVDTNTMVLATQEILGGGHWAVIGGVYAVFTAIVIFGGIKRIGKVCEFLSPFMAGAYILGGILIILFNITSLPEAIKEIVVYAFDPQAAFGGAAGMTVVTCMRYGFARGIFSNEAGLGSAGITHSSARVNTPGEQAVWGPLEVFVDTILVCTITGLSIMLTGVWDCGKDGVALTMYAFDTGLPGHFGHYIVFAAAILFGYSCLITYYNYAQKAAAYIFGSKSDKVILVLWIALMFVGAYSTLGVVWDIADTVNGLIIYPNLIGLLVMFKQIVKIKDDFYGEQLPIYKEEKRLKKQGK